MRVVPIADLRISPAPRFSPGGRYNRYEMPAASATRYATFDQSTVVQWTDGTNFNGFLLVSLVLPSTGSYTEAVYSNSFPQIPVPDFLVCPIINGTFSNQLTTAAALSQTSLEQLLIQVRQAVDNNGKKIRLTAKKLVVPPALTFQAEVLLKSVLRAGNANNDINPVRSMGMLAGGQAVISRMTSTTNWFLHTDAGDAQQYGLNVMVRRGVEKSMEGDFETDSMRYKAGERYIPGWTDPRTLYGTAGA